MINPRDPYWDELGAAWCAMETGADSLTSNLKSRLRRQSLIMTATIFIGIPLATIVFIVGAITIWIGWRAGTWNFVTRGFAIAIVSTMAMKAIWPLLPLRSNTHDWPLLDLLGLAVTRSQRLLSTIQLSLGACAVASVFGLIGTAIRYHAGRPPALSPAVDVGILVLVSLALIGYRRRVKTELAKLEYLRRTFATDAPVEGRR